MKILSLTLLLILMACGKSSGNKSGSKEQDPITDCNDVRALCATPVEWTIETRQYVPENFQISVTIPNERSERTYIVLDTCKGDSAEVRHGRRRQLSKIKFEKKIRLDSSVMNRLQLVDLGPDCRSYDVIFDNYIPRLVVIFDSQRDEVVRQTIRLEN